MDLQRREPSLVLALMATATLINSTRSTDRMHPDGPERMDSWAPDDLVPASMKYKCENCSQVRPFVKNENFTKCETCIENRWIPGGRFWSVTKNLNKEFDRITSLHLKFADTVTEFVGNMSFLYLHIIWFGAWIGINIGWIYPGREFDPYPFGLLTMIVSLEAIFLTTLVMVSQNVQAKRSELRAELDYQVNLKAEKEVVAIHEELRENNDMTQRLIEMVETKKGRLK